MNQYPDFQHFSLTPDLSPLALESTLARLLVSGVITNSNMERHCCKLDERFRIFAATCPVPEWAPWLHIDAEMRRQYELYLPVSESRAALAAFCKLACRYEPLSATPAIATALSWPDALARLQPLLLPDNPARLLRQLAASELFRFAFLAAIFIPQSYGGGFSRYPLQTEYFYRWLSKEKERLLGKIDILDAACGSGEGTYAAATAVLQCGFSASASLVEGCTLEPLELVAAAHGWFPQDKVRSTVFRERIRSLLTLGGESMVRFSQEDLCRPWPEQKSYDVIFCNGLLGGPLLHGKEQLAGVISLLAQRLKAGGILLAADRFHEGWRQKTPSAILVELLMESGLQTFAAGEGVGAVKNE